MAEERKIPHFDVSAAVIRQLGEELVTDEVTAIMELIKNSYDADADWVKVEINTKDPYNGSNTFYKDSKPGYIIIEDNGFGMSDDDILNGWLIISLSSKRKFKAEGKLTPKRRTPLGEKGVGRLSTQKLGTRLELFTGQEGVETLYRLSFDWDKFNDDTSLSDVPVELNSLSKDKNYKGTTLLLTNLKETKKWEGISWDEFRGQISQMIFPFKEKRAFNVYIKINGQNVDLDELNVKIRENAVSKYSFDVGKDILSFSGSIMLQKLNGSNNPDNIAFYEKNILPDLGKDFFDFLTNSTNNKKWFTDNIQYVGQKGVFFKFKREIGIENIDKMLFLDVDEDKKIVAHPGPFNGEIDDFYFKETDSIENAFNSYSEYKRIVQNQVGVRIFRDGFGIKPYGINGHDWLKLSEEQTSGASFYGLRPKNIIGYVSLTAKENKVLTEKTDREGFNDNQYSRNFHRIVDYFISEINSILQSLRRSYNDYKSLVAQQSTGVTTIKESFEKLQRASAKAKSTSKRAKEVKENLASVANQVKVVAEKQFQQPKTPQDEERDNLLNLVSHLLEDAKSLLEEVESVLEDAQKLEQHVEFLKPQMENLESQLSDFSELAGLGLTAETLSHELSNIVDRITEETDRINRQVKGKTTVELTPVSIYIESVRVSTRSFRKQLSHLAPSFRYVRESKDSILLSVFLSEIKEYYDERFKGSIEFATEIYGSDFYLSMNKGRLIQIFDNIILNSEYWLREKMNGELDFKPLIKIEGREPFIRIFDNGNGIENGIQDRIFQPFITAKPRKLGRGLGLFIVQQLLEGVGCDAILLSEKNQYGRRYIFQLNMSSVIENQ